MINAILRPLAKLPLRLFHLLGVALGWLAYLLSAGYARRLSDNIATSGIALNQKHYTQLKRQSIGEIGKSVTELVVAWFRPLPEVARLVERCEGWGYVEAALVKRRGIIFITPHLGSYDIAGRYMASRLPITFLYRPPKLKGVEILMNAGRDRGDAKMATADFRGVRTIVSILRNKGAVCILPDQVPSQGDGVWAPFFNRPAYTMTLIGRLQQVTGAEVILFYGERLKCGKGYVVHIEPLATLFNGEGLHDATVLNRAIEALIRRSPSQYLWSYNRYKTPSELRKPN